MKFGLSGGWSTEIFGDGRLGFVANAGYRNKWRFQDRAQRTFALTTNDMDEDTLVLRNDTREDRTDQNITLNGLFTLAAEWEKHQIRANTFAVNQTQRRTQLTTGEIQGTDDLFIQDYLLSWIERFLLAQQLTGEHDFGWLVVDYEALYAQAQRSAPDRRTYRFARRPGADVFSVPDQEGLDRSYSFVDETVLTAGLDLSFLLFGDEEDPFRPTVKVGAFASQIDRTAGEQRFRFTPASGADRRDPVAEEIFDPDRVGEDLLDIRDNSILGADDYEGSSEILAAYAMADIGILDIFRIVGGVRWESAVYELRAFQLAQGGGGGTVQVESGFDQTELLPAAAVTWFILEELQLRAAYGRTVSRPVFNELSPSSFFDPDTGQEYVGNEDLVPTTIDGYDARIEWYPSSTENFNLGVFFKEYTDPLERTFQPVAGGDPIATFQNADSAQVLGLEVGGRVEGGRLGDLFGGSSFLDNIYVLANAAIMDSTVDLAEQGVATDETRALDGQADLVLNAQAGYDGENVDFTAAFIYIGTRLRRVGIQGQPNILQDPIPVLDLNFSWRFAKDWVLSASASNLLNPTIRLTQQVEGEAPREFRAFTRGIQLGAGLKWTFL
jgi:TonB-dependent receptor